MDPISTPGIRKIPLADTSGTHLSRISEAANQADSPAFNMQDEIVRGSIINDPLPMMRRPDLATSIAAKKDEAPLADASPAGGEKKIESEDYYFGVGGFAPGKAELYRDLGLNGPSSVGNLTLFTLSGQPINVNEPPRYLLQE